jgi:multidrug efflux pump subunit AcrA (membrane-fusion protein)
VKSKKNWKPYVGALVLAMMLVFIVRFVLAEPSTAPRQKDRVAAQRTSTAAGARDERAAAPREGLVAGNAIVEPRDRETKVAAAAPGRIAAIAVQEGEKVARGALLVQLEDGPEQAALQAAEADYQKALHGQRREDIEATMNDAEAARARAEESAEAFRRTAQAAKGGAATADELDKARSQAESDQRTFEASEARRRAMAAGSRYEDIAAARARRDQAKANLERLAVRAPIDGEILQVKYRVGEYVTPGGDPLVVMGDTSALRVRIDVDERDIGHIAVGDVAFAVADAYPEKKFSGKVVEIGHRMGRKNVRTDDPTERIDTKILETVIELDDPTGLVPGLRVTGYIEGGR